MTLEELFRELGPRLGALSELAARLGCSKNVAASCRAAMERFKQGYPRVKTDLLV